MIKRILKTNKFNVLVVVLLLMSLAGFVSTRLNPPVAAAKPLYNPWDTPLQVEEVDGLPRQDVPSDGAAVFNGVKNEMVVHLGDTFTVNSIKCMKPDVDARVTYKGSKYWRSIQPAGETYTVYKDVPSYTDPGCTPIPYAQTIPPEVEAKVKNLALDGQFVSEWQISGTLVADVTDTAKYSAGTPVHWYTQNFVIDSRPKA